MTAPHFTIKTPRPIAATLFTAAGASTLLAVLHAIVAAQNDWPPQLMTLHVAATLGFWYVAFRVQDRSRDAAGTTVERVLAPGVPSYYDHVDELTAIIHPLDQLELDELERRLRDTDG